METRGFEELRVYRVAERLGDLVWALVQQWTPFAKDTIGKQLVGSADSVGANIAEGSGRGTYQDNRRFVRMARGSLYETRHWLRRASKRQLLTSQQIEEIKPLIHQLGPQLNAYLKSIGQTNANRQPPTTNDQ